MGSKQEYAAVSRLRRRRIVPGADAFEVTPEVTPSTAREITSGIGANWAQIALLMALVGLVGGMIGVERSVLSPLAEQQFGLASRLILLSFVVSFGLVKSLFNLFAGRMSDRYGRKQVLVFGWLVGLLSPVVVILAPSWGWVVFANALLGANQGLCWSTTQLMKIDLAGPGSRGLAVGLNEAAGYVAAALAALGASYLAAVGSLRSPFYLSVAFAAVGLILSVLLLRGTKHHVQAESRRRDETMCAGGAKTLTPGCDGQSHVTFRQILLMGSGRDRTFSAASQAGLLTNLKDGVAWGLFPLFFASAGLSMERIGLLVAAYPAVWGLSQLGTGALSDRLGRKALIVVGMGTQSAATMLLVLAHGFWPWLGASALLGLGTAFVYPLLPAVVSDIAHPGWRASAVGVYRLWRDSGYAIGGLMAGVLTDAFNMSWAIAAVGILLLASAGIVAVRMEESLQIEGVLQPVRIAYSAREEQQT